MNKKTFTKQEIFERIEELYFSDKFKEVVAFWEDNNIYFQIDNKSQVDNKILEAVATSYYETGIYKKSLLYVNAQLKQLKTLELQSHEKREKYRYYYLNKVNIYDKQSKRIMEYKIVREYLKRFGSDGTFIKLSNSLEEYFYKKYLMVNKYIGYIVLMLILIAILLPLLFNFRIPSNIYRPYNILSIIFVVWIVLNLLFPKIFKKCLLSGIKYFLTLSYRVRIGLKRETNKSEHYF